MKTWRDLIEEEKEVRKADGMDNTEDLDNPSDFLKWLYGFNSLDEEMPEDKANVFGKQ